MKYSFTLTALAAVASAQEFTSLYNITATPDQVIGPNGPAPGQTGARGQFNYAINSKTDTICYDITLTGVTGDYQSAAKTATHIHEAVKGANGPPRIAFPNPGPITDGVRRSSGCLTGPFTTGLTGPDNSTDTGAGFRLAQIEANPAGFFTDSHTALFIPGVVRGQLDQSFVIIDRPIFGNGSEITTATLTKTELATFTKCPTYVTDCPADGHYVTEVEKVYTTVCPVSDLPYYTKPATCNGCPVETIYNTKPGVPVYTKPGVPVETLCPGCPTDSIVTKPGVPVQTQPPAVVCPGPQCPTGTAPGAPAGPTGVEFTGAASAIKVGGALMVAGLAAALL